MGFNFRFTPGSCCGCATCINCASGTTPSQVQVTLSNFIDSATCTECASKLNATFLLDVPSSNPSDPQPMGTTAAGCTWWLQLADTVCGYTVEIVATVDKDVSGVFLQVQLWSPQQDDLSTAILTWKIYLNSDYHVPVDCGFDVSLGATDASQGFFAMSDGGRMCKTNSGTDGNYNCHAVAIP